MCFGDLVRFRKKMFQWGREKKVLTESESSFFGQYSERYPGADRSKEKVEKKIKKENIEKEDKEEKI